jgi:hypothetical protein
MISEFEDDEDDTPDLDWNTPAPRGSLVAISGDYILLYHDGIGESYDIALNRITAPDDMLRWIEQLIGKTWITRGHIREFVRVVADRRGWALHPVR